MKLKWILLLVVQSAWLLAAANRPNVIVILADDLGYGSVGCYGAPENLTPNIDQIAREGIRFTDANTPSSVCTPTRYGLLMGEYPWRKSIMLDCNPTALMLPEGQPTLASLFKSEGYATACIGKWHLGFGNSGADWAVEFKPGPLERGFDYYFGFPINIDGLPVVYIENHHLVDGSDPLDPNDPTVGGSKSYVDYDNMTDVMTDKAVSFIKDNQDNPFFLYFPTHQVHRPIYPADRFVGTSGIGNYGDFIVDLDWSVGEILKTLDELELTDNTLILFTSDNGGLPHPKGVGKVARVLGEKLRIPVEKDGHLGFFRNAPFSGYKWGDRQGGFRVPFVARWPGKIVPGSESDELISLVDIYATIRDLFGKEDDGEGPDSVSFLGQMVQEMASNESPRTHLIYQGGKTSFFGLREKEWLLTVGGKPVSMFVGNENDARPQQPSLLYHLSVDPKEETNVYGKYPDVVNRMTQILEREKAGLPQ